MANIPVHIKMLIDEYVKHAQKFYICAEYEPENFNEIKAERDYARERLEVAIKKYNDDAIARAKKK